MAGESEKRYYSRDLVTLKFCCNFCKKIYAKGTTSTRLRAHLTGEPKTGARKCRRVPPSVRDSLAQSEISAPPKPPSAERGVTEAMAKSVLPPNGSGAKSYLDNQRPSGFSSQQNEAGSYPCQFVTPEVNSYLDNQTLLGLLSQQNGTSSYSHQIVSDANDNFRNQREMTPLVLLPNGSGANNEFCHHGEITPYMPHVPPGETSEGAVGLTEEVIAPDETSSNPEQIESGANSYYYRSLLAALNNDFDDQGGELPYRMSTHPNESCNDEILRLLNDMTGESPLLTNKPVSDNAFEKNVNEIKSLLMDDQVVRVSIYGMRGVGKTNLMRRIQTLLERQNTFEVYWVTVSQDFSIWKLQNRIAKKIDLKFSDNENEVKRAKELAQAIRSKGKCVLILDDLRYSFDADKVGIPVGVNRCRLLLTTTLLTVCQQMDCNKRNTIQVQPLCKEEAWILFTQELGNYRIEAKEVEKVAKDLCLECAGLPLGIRVMAGSMKGISDVSTWRDILERLKKSKCRKGYEMEEVFCVLNSSYFRLNDEALQECLSYCTLFPEDDFIDRNELIEYMIVEGIIDERRSRKAGLDEGHKMLDTLENACLLEGDTRFVWMHDLIRDMVTLELREGSIRLVKAGAQLTELPGVEKWTTNLVRVSLMCNDIKVILSDNIRYIPMCPNLSTLSLSRNHGLKVIADSFFKKFQNLKILDLTSCHAIEELPTSISDLVNLTALLLHKCKSLTYVPSLLKLVKLEKLDLGHCGKLQQMPHGVSLDLKYLDLSKTGIDEIKSGIIPGLSQLQVLKLCNKYGVSNFSIRGSEVGALGKLETLYCRFSDPNEFGEYMESRTSSQQSLTDYSFFIQRGGSSSHWPTSSRKFVSVTDYSFIDISALPADIETLNTYNCGTQLFPPTLLASLLNIRVYEEENGKWMEFPFPNWPFLHLKLINICNYDKLKKLFPPSLLSNLQNLENILVEYCNDMEEIFSTDQEEEEAGQHDLPGIQLPSLTTLELRSLPKLKNIYKGPIICHSLQVIELTNCPNLLKITLPFLQPSLQGIQVYPQEWMKKEFQENMKSN